MFRLGKSDKDPLVDVKSAARWLASMPPSDPLALQIALVAHLGRLAAVDARRTPAGLEAVFFVDTQAHAIRKALATQYVTHARRSPMVEAQLWRALFDLTQAFLACYSAYGREVAAHVQDGRWQSLLPELMGRQLVHLGLDARARLYHCEAWIPGRWAEFYALFALACAQQVERRPLLLDPHAGPTTIEHEFIVTLVLERMNPGNLGAEQVEWLATQLQNWCRPLRLALESAAPATFYIDLASREGLRRRDTGPLEGRVLFLDTRSLHAVLRQNIVSLEQKIRDEPLASDAARDHERLAMFTKLAVQIDPEFRPLPRRGNRVAAKGTVDAVVGFAKICACMHDETLSLLNQDAGKSFSGAMELAVFGQSRRDAARLYRDGERRLTTYLAAGGPWEVKDVSATGFRVVAPAVGSNAVGLGTLVALRLHDQDRWILCIVRRMTRRTTERAEIGLEIIANTLVGVELAEQRKFADPGYSVDGEPAMLNGRVFHGLLLAIATRPGGPEVQSVVIPAVEYHPARRFRLKTPRTVFSVRFGRQLDAQADWTWAAIESLERSEAPGDLAAPIG